MRPNFSWDSSRNATTNPCSFRESPPQWVHPQALTTLLKAHFVDGYYPGGSLSGASYGQTDREVTNQLKQKLRLLQSGDSTTINGLSVMWMPHTVGNGNRVQLIDKLLPVK